MNEEWLDMGSDRFAWTSAQSTAADRARVRREALEEAARVCDKYAEQNRKIERHAQAEAQRFIAYAIRSSIDAKPER